jgi:hypothetical protein
MASRARDNCEEQGARRDKIDRGPGSDVEYKSRRLADFTTKTRRSAEARRRGAGRF